MDVNKLEKLAKLKEMGAITEEEYNKGKKEAMEESTVSKTFQDKKFGLSDKHYNVLMHLSQFGSAMIPMLGIVLPIVLWVMNKDNDAMVDAHGRNILNWNISLLVYLLVCCVLMFVLIGFVLIWIPCICMIIFPIIGAAKASNGTVWKYPFSFKIL